MRLEIVCGKPGQPVAGRAELLAALRPLAQGVYLMPSFGRYEVAAEVLEILDSEKQVR